MNTLVEIQGWVSNSHHNDPKKQYGYEDRYQLEVSPFNSYDLDDIERRVEMYKEMAEQNFNPEQGYGYNCYSNKDEITNGSSIVFQSLHQIKLHPDLRCLSDDELVGKFVKVVGHIQQHKEGNCFISYHIVDPSFREVPESFDDDEPFDEDF